THVLSAFDDSHAFAEVSRLGAALFAGRAAADDDEVESVAGSHGSLRRVLMNKAAPSIREDCRRTGGMAEKFLADAYWKSSRRENLWWIGYFDKECRNDWKEKS